MALTWGSLTAYARPNATAHARANSPPHHAGNHHNHPRRILAACTFCLPASVTKPVHARNITQPRRLFQSSIRIRSPTITITTPLNHPHHGCQRTAGVRPGVSGTQHHGIVGGSRTERAGTSVSGAISEVGMYECVVVGAQVADWRAGRGMDNHTSYARVQLCRCSS